MLCKRLKICVLHILNEMKRILNLEKEIAKKEVSKKEKFKGEIVEKKRDLAIIRFNKPVKAGKTLGYFKDEKLLNYGYVLAKDGEFALVRRFTTDNPDEFLECENLSLYDVQIELLSKFDPKKLVPFKNFDKLRAIKSNNLDKWQSIALSATLEMKDNQFLLIVGPPGTGKTRFISEAAKKVNGKVLVTSHTNRAVDNVLEKFSEKNKVRIGHFNRNNKNLEDLESILEFEKTIKRKVKDAKVVGATLMKCAFFNFPEKFEYVFIDEASQTTISEVLSAIFNGKRIVLVGDPFQLPPILKCEKSERFSAFNFFYRKSKKAIWLRTHYRSNSEIIGFSSKYIYGRKIKAHESCKNVYLEIKKDPKRFHSIVDPYLPVVFVIVSGVEKMVGKSKINKKEAEMCFKLCEELNRCGIKDIGVITPYIEQKNLIRDLTQNLPVEVDTVDAFQGREKDVIIYSFVSSNNIEFSSNWRRFNVAITRAKKKLIVISNLSAINNGKNTLLYKFYKYTKNKNSVFYVG